MQHEVSEQPMVGEVERRPRRARELETERRHIVDYLSDGAGVIAGSFGHFGGFVSQQTRERPLIVGSLFLGIVGGIVGARIAQIQAMQRRRSGYERMMETLGYIGALAFRRIPMRRKAPVDLLRERGQGIIETTRDLGSSIVAGVPAPERPMEETFRGPLGTLRQVGYGLSLIPVALAFFRNPLVRSLGFRYLRGRAFRR